MDRGVVGWKCCVCHFKPNEFNPPNEHSNHSHPDICANPRLCLHTRCDDCITLYPPLLKQLTFKIKSTFNNLIASWTPRNGNEPQQTNGNGNSNNPESSSSTSTTIMNNSDTDITTSASSDSSDIDTEPSQQPNYRKHLASFRGKANVRSESFYKSMGANKARASLRRLLGVQSASDLTPDAISDSELCDKCIFQGTRRRVLCSMCKAFGVDSNGYEDWTDLVEGVPDKDHDSWSSS